MRRDPTFLGQPEAPEAAGMSEDSIAPLLIGLNVVTHPGCVRVVVVLKGCVLKYLRVKGHDL